MKLLVRATCPVHRGAVEFLTESEFLIRASLNRRKSNLSESCSARSGEVLSLE